MTDNIEPAYADSWGSKTLEFNENQDECFNFQICRYNTVISANEMLNMPFRVENVFTMIDAEVVEPQYEKIKVLMKQATDLSKTTEIVQANELKQIIAKLCVSFQIIVCV